MLFDAEYDYCKCVEDVSQLKKLIRKELKDNVSYNLEINLHESDDRDVIKEKILNYFNDIKYLLSRGYMYKIRHANYDTYISRRHVMLKAEYTNEKEIFDVEYEENLKYNSQIHNLLTADMIDKLDINKLVNNIFIHTHIKYINRHKYLNLVR